MIIKNRVQETASANTTVSFTLAGASAGGYRTFVSTMSIGDQCRYCATAGTAWETGVGTYSATNTLTRTIIEDSSNSGAATTFTGTVTVTLALTAKAIASLNNTAPVPKGIVQGSYIRFAQANGGGTKTYAPCMLRSRPTIGNTLISLAAGGSTLVAPSNWTTLVAVTAINTYEYVSASSYTVDAKSSGGVDYVGWDSNAGNVGLIEVAGYSTFVGFSGAPTVSGNTITASVPASSTSALVIVVFHHDGNVGLSSVGTGLTLLSDFGYTDVSTNHEAYVCSLVGSASTQSPAITLAGVPSQSSYHGVICS